MKKKKYILFDLDGTLTDPMEGITKSVQYALRAFGINVEDRTQLCRFIGPPLADSFKNFYGLDEQQAKEAIVKYREYFTPTGIFENEVYDGVPELLARLKADGKSLILATSKPTQYAEMILEHFGLSQYFSFVSGSNFDGTRVKKADVIQFALDENGIDNLDEAVMVGDREHDVIGAKSVGMECIGVLYGYGDAKEMEAAEADYVAETVDELERLLSCNTEA